MSRFRRLAAPRTTSARFASALLAGCAVVVLSVGVAQAQTVGLRGAVEEEELVPVLRRPSLANRSTSLEKKAKDAKDAKKAVAPEAAPAEQDDPFRIAEPDSPDGEAQEDAAAAASDEPMVIADDPGAEKPRKPAKDESPDPSEAVDRIEPPEDLGANERTLAENAPVPPLDNRDITGEADPYAAVGVRVGTFLLKPSLEQGLSWTSNASGGGAALYSETTLRLGAASDWSRHAATLDAYGTWLQPVSGSAPAEPMAGIDASLRIDLERPWTLTGKASWALAREAADSAVPVPAGASRAIENAFAASLEAAKGEGKARLAATLGLERLAYGDATLSGGGVLSQAERNQTLVTAKLRAGYEVSPALVPFAEIEAGRRIHDLELDSAGYARSGTQLALRAGFEFDREEKLNGELAVGWLRESFDDARLAPISGLSLEGEASWSPFRDTTVTLNGSTTVESTTTAGRSGSLLHAAELAATRQVRANLSVQAGLSASLRDYSGSADADTILAASAGFTWWMNRHFGLTGRARHESVQSTIAGNSSQTTSFFLGVKAQR